MCWYDSDEVGSWLGVLFIAAVVAVIVVGVVFGVRDCRVREQAQEQLYKELHQVCGSDVVYSYDRFGALDTNCYKVVCFQTSENRGYERFTNCGGPSDGK